MPLTIIIITKNEATNIRACLESVRFADEIIVVDSGSTDGTPDICRQFGARVEITDWPGFGPQKNRALALAQGDWVLSIDADEQVTPELQGEILSTLQTGQCTAYAIPRLSSYLGRPMRHSGWYPDYVVRLFQRDQARFSDDLVHERLLFAGKAERLQSHLLHESFTSLEQVINKLNHYSTAGAQMAYRKGKSAGLASAILKGFVAFLRTYILRAGFLDGREGLMLAISNAEGTYYRQLKLMLLNEKRA